MRTNLATSPRPSQAFPRDENAHHRAPNASQLLDASEIKDIGEGRLIASVKDENDNIIGLIQ